eukprot:59561-Chlamydomonas_euryale.AAC.1
MMTRVAIRGVDALEKSDQHNRRHGGAAWLPLAEPRMRTRRARAHCWPPRLAAAGPGWGGLLTRRTVGYLEAPA